MAKFGARPVVTRTLIHGTDHKTDVRLCERRLRDLHKQVAFDDPQFLARQQELLVELARLKALEPVPDEWVEKETGQTLAALWEACADDFERNAFLLAHRFRVHVFKDHLDMEQGERGGKFYSSVSNVPLIKIPPRRPAKGDGAAEAVA